MNPSSTECDRLLHGNYNVNRVLGYCTCRHLHGYRGVLHVATALDRAYAITNGTCAKGVSMPKDISPCIAMYLLVYTYIPLAHTYIT